MGIVEIMRNRHDIRGGYGRFSTRALKKTPAADRSAEEAKMKNETRGDAVAAE